jgi:Rrf2 family transcriptional regulator, nitric oxide-sensitive transcriptional repressor
MRLTLYTDYSLRVLLYLVVDPEHTATIAEIATSYGISRNHLVKVVNNLVRLGYVRSTRGRSGGLRLNASPGAVTVGEVVRRTEHDFRFVECFDPATNTCPIAGVCRLESVLYEARKAFFSTLDRYSLADFAKPQAGLLRILRPPGRAASK